VLSLQQVTAQEAAVAIFTVRILDDASVERLSVRGAEHVRSAEAELRESLQAV